ncbi:hypothetical protein F5Y15DRAFT_424443 [Xylariaceae sp. FL0016]|nr:hypothetical protein F5Y15DRAFT_424443 [Xylariaceae sp. FL0016]
MPGRLSYAPKPVQKPLPSDLDEWVRDDFPMLQRFSDEKDNYANDDLVHYINHHDSTGIYRDVILDSGSIAKSSWMLQLKAANKPAIEAGKAAARNTGLRGTGSRKRKSDATFEDQIAAYKQNLDRVKTKCMHIDRSPGQVRALINQVIQRGIMRKGEFCSATGLSVAAVNNFLKHEYPMDGDRSQVYPRAWDWFIKREIAGLPMPNANVAEKQKKRKTQPSASPMVFASTTARTGALPPISTITPATDGTSM